jgi:hypothetical protein
MYLPVALLYAAICGVVAWFAARRASKKSGLRWAIGAGLFPVLLAAPLVDEIVGTFQFERLCKEAADVSVYGTVTAGEDLYTPEGKWRIGLRGADAEQQRARQSLERYLRWELGPTTVVNRSSAIPIQRFDATIRDARTGRVLAGWRQYGTRGGWISQMFETPLLVQRQCMPEIVAQSRVQELVVKYEGPKGAK